MADTRQVVSWSLERKCAYRSGEQWFLPDQTRRQLTVLRIVADAQGDCRNVDGICVTSWTLGNDNAGKTHNIPCDGFRIEERLKPFGGIEAALMTCRDCEANAKNEFGIQVAGCAGCLDARPDSTDLERELWGVIEQRNLEEWLRAAFPVTTPL